MKPLRKDPALWFFGLVALACLSVSIPATLIAMELFHGATWGKPAVVVFEIGAVGAELATIAIPQWRRRLMFLTILLLLATSGTNYAHGADLFVQAAAPGTYEAIRNAGYGWLLATIAAGMFPALLFVFLTAFTARWRMLRARYDTPLKVVAFWLAVHWCAVRHEYDMHVARLGAELETVSQGATQAGEELARLRQEHERHVTSLSTEMAQMRHELTQAEHTLAQRPALMTEEVITISRREVSVRQLARVLELPESTVRRKVARLEESRDL